MNDVKGSSLVDALTKGWPAGRGPVALADIGALGLDVLRGDLTFPVAVLKESALADNAAFMRAFLAHTGATIAPHGKTTMAPALFERQLADGAWGITLATCAQLQIARRFGVSRVFYANQLVGRQEVAFVIDELAGDPTCEVISLADDVGAVAALARACAALGLTRRLPLVVEIGLAGQRTGCRTLEAALAVARAIAASPHLALVGVEGFEGLIHSDDARRDADDVRAFLARMVEAARALHAESLFAPGTVWLSAGGSAYYDLVAEVLGASGIPEARVLLRCGCYLTHDDAIYSEVFAHARARTPALRAMPTPRGALEVWTQVLSRPELGRAILNAGKRDLGADMGMPVVLGVARAGGPLELLSHSARAAHRIAALNDQHAHLVLPEGSALAAGDLVALGVSHPCTTFDKWQTVFLVDDTAGARRVTGAVRTFF